MQSAFDGRHGGDWKKNRTGIVLFSLSLSLARTSDRAVRPLFSVSFFFFLPRSPARGFLPYGKPLGQIFVITSYRSEDPSLCSLFHHRDTFDKTTREWLLRRYLSSLKKAFVLLKSVHKHVRFYTESKISGEIPVSVWYHGMSPSRMFLAKVPVQFRPANSELPSIADGQIIFHFARYYPSAACKYAKW